jgi:maltose alpha-D-glucosyltransferase/alpha-amylase
MDTARSEQEQHFNALVELTDFAGLLGQRLGEMHQALAQPTDDPAFRSRVSTQEDAQAWTRGVSAQVERAMQLLEQRRGELDEASVALVDDLLGRREVLLEHVATLCQQAVGGLIMRVHGDLHLGQVLVVQGDAYLIDFEGEPARPLEERRGMYSPYKDVSGVLRSFDYAAAMAVRNAQSVDVSEQADEVRKTVGERYLQQAQRAFIEAYGLATASLPHAWEDTDGERAALELFSLEKAAYEIAYEAENRPSWLAVPLHGLFGLLSTKGESQ